MNTQPITIDVSKQPGTVQAIRIGQGDKNGTTIQASIYDNGAPLALSGYSVRFEMRLPDGTSYYQSPNGTVSGNVATIPIDETYAGAVDGITKTAYIVVYSNSVVCSTSRINVIVLESAEEGADAAHAYSSGIIEATERAIAAAEAAEGVVLQDVPLMSATIRGGAQLGTGLEITDGVLSVDSATVPIPTMSASVKGGAKLGAGLSVADDTLSLSGESYTSAEKSKLAGIEANANNYTLPTMGASTKGGAKLGDGLSVANDMLSVDVSDVASGQLPIAHGGTGAATAAAALSNLGAAAVDSDGFVTVAGEPSYPLFIWDSTHVSPEDYSGTYPISPCFVYYIPNKGLYYCTDN